MKNRGSLSALIALVGSMIFAVFVLFAGAVVYTLLTDVPQDQAYSVAAAPQEKQARTRVAAILADTAGDDFEVYGNEVDLFLMINRDRVVNGKKPVLPDWKMWQSAREYSLELRKITQSGQDPRHSPKETRPKQDENVLHSWSNVPENSVNSPADMHRLYMDSADGHKDNILGDTTTHVGIGTVVEDQGGVKEYWNTERFIFKDIGCQDGLDSVTSASDRKQFVDAWNKHADTCKAQKVVLGDEYFIVTKDTKPAEKPVDVPQELTNDSMPTPQPPKVAPPAQSQGNVAKPPEPPVQNTERAQGSGGSSPSPNALEPNTKLPEIDNAQFESQYEKLKNEPIGDVPQVSTPAAERPIDPEIDPNLPKLYPNGDPSVKPRKPGSPTWEGPCYDDPDLGHGWLSFTEAKNGEIDYIFVSEPDCVPTWPQYFRYADKGK